MTEWSSPHLKSLTVSARAAACSPRPPPAYIWGGVCECDWGGRAESGSGGEGEEYGNNGALIEP